MKRSQMIKVILDALYCHFPNFDTSNTYIAECILQSIEGGNSYGVGMRPPLWDNFNASQSERTFSSDSDWHYHGEDAEGNRRWSLQCDYWEEE